LKSKLAKLLALLMALMLVAAACGSDDEDEATETDDDTTEEADAEAGTEESDDDSPEEEEGGGDMEEAGLSGDIVISGSSTVEPISVAVAESYAGIQPDVNVAVSGPGTGDGFKLFCAGETDISDASRQIKDSEAEDCAANGINYVELKVAVDGIAVMTSEANTAIDCLSFIDLYSLIGPEAAGFGTWADANDLNSELGGSGDFPDAELFLTAPGTESGTYDSFVEIVLEDIADERAQEIAPRPDYQSAADDNLIIEGISTNDFSLGWVGFAFANEATGVKLIEVSEEDGGTCVAATPETIASNEYPIARDLFIYINTDKAAESAALADFVDYYMTFGLDDAAAAVGYVELTDDSKAETVAAWEGR
jgi:phosphate transport system substrate-binding protein